jgi:hypothetical protein
VKQYKVIKQDINKYDPDEFIIERIAPKKKKIPFEEQ